MYWVLSIVLLIWVLKNRKGIWRGLQASEEPTRESCSFESESMKQQELDEIRAYFEAKISLEPPQGSPHD